MEWKFYLFFKRDVHKKFFLCSESSLICIKLFKACINHIIVFSNDQTLAHICFGSSYRSYLYVNWDLTMG